MNIEQIDTARILISLGEKDMKKYAVTFESLNFSEAHSKTVLKDIMSCASAKTGIDFKNKKVLIEALKYEHGCLLLITLSKRQKTYRVKYYDNSYIFVFDSVENFLSCIKAVYDLKGDKFLSSAYLYAQRYYLVIKSSVRLKEKYINVMSEFCSISKRGNLLNHFLEEHAKVLKLNNAVQSIGCFLN